jgi:hypothetical protein
MTSARNRLFEDIAIGIKKGSTYYSRKMLGLPVDSPPTDIENSASWVKVRAALQSAGVTEQEMAAALIDPLLTQAHSFLVMLDGGTKLSEHGRIYVKDHEDNFVGEGLHELFFDYLDDQGFLQPWSDGQISEK